MDKFHLTDVMPGIDILNVPTDEFKTNIVSFEIAAPLSFETVSVNSLVLSLLTRRTKKFDSIEKLNRYLAYLYGAKIGINFKKEAYSQVLDINLIALDNRFSLDDMNITDECISLMMSLLFDPCLDENDCFFEEDIEREKRLLVEKIADHEDDKRTYAVDKAISIMYRGEPYEVNIIGDRKKVHEITAASATAAYKKLLETAKFRLCVVGNMNIEKTLSLMREKFSLVNRQYIPIEKEEYKYSEGELKQEVERMNVTQSKLILGFRAKEKIDEKDSEVLKMLSDIFGGGVYSKLFLNVREKMSLCYYCQTMANLKRGFILVTCGCEEDKCQEATDEILRQYANIKNGDIDMEFAASKIGLANVYNSIVDLPEGIASWFHSQFMEDEIEVPDDKIREINKVAKDQIINCSNKFVLDTIYKLLPKEDEE